MVEEVGLVVVAERVAGSAKGLDMAAALVVEQEAASVAVVD